MCAQRVPVAVDRIKILIRQYALMLGVAAMILASGPAIAGDQYNCIISGVGAFSHTDGWYLQCDGGERVNANSCVSYPTQWAMPWSANASKEIYALAMSMWLTGKPVRLNGTGQCDTAYGGRETLTGLERYGM